MTGKYSGGMTGLLNRVREEKVEPTAALAARPQTEVTETQVPEAEALQTQVLPAQVRELGEPRSVSSALPGTEAPQTQAPQTRAQKTQAPESEVTRPAGRFLQIDHAVLDEFLPRLQPYEQLVYLRLFRLTVGFNRPTCTVSHGKLAEKTRLSISTIKRTCAQLEANGYIRTRAVLGGSPADRGCEIEVLEPASLLGTQARETRVGKTQARGAGAQQAQVREADMKDRKENHEKAPGADAPASVYEIRTIAARLFEAHRGELGFSNDRLRALVRDALIGQGRQPDDGVIEEAIRGMAV